MTFEKELAHLLNKYSQENGADTPDFILAHYLADCLRAWDRSMAAREKWYGRSPTIHFQDTELFKEWLKRKGYDWSKMNLSEQDRVRAENIREMCDLVINQPTRSEE